MAYSTHDRSSLPHVPVNGRDYGPASGPVVVVCIDGSEPAYHEHAVSAGRMPFLEKVIADGTCLHAESAMPSFTNPNNLSIATGVPPAGHGICGNYFFDRESGREVMMNEPSLLRVPTIFARYAEAGTRVAVITAKDKLRRLLGVGRGDGICFSAEHADKATREEHGIYDVLSLVGMPLPSVYSAELSEFAMVAGVRVLETYRPDLMYISLTDYVQHKHPPGSTEADGFYGMLDRYFQQIDALGAVLVVTADHGMNAKSDAHGNPRVVYVQQTLDEWLGAGNARVILPITDPYTVHHGALGSFATVYLQNGVDPAGVASRLGELTGIDLVLTAQEACARFELPPDRTGDLIIVAGRETALGTSPDRHDLTQLDEPLRSHGGLCEQGVPFIVNRPVEIPEGDRLRNYDAYWVALNAVAT